MRGNVLDMAVGIIVGAAFTAIVTSLVDGSYIMALINFLIVAFVLSTRIKFRNKAASLGKKPKEEAPTTKECPYCKSEISIEATRCPNCTSYLP